MSEFSSKESGRHVGPYSNDPPAFFEQLYRVVRGLFGGLVMSFILTGGTLLAILSFGYRSQAWFHHVARMGARVMCWAWRIKVRVINGHHFSGRAPRIVVFNHSSQLDMFSVASIVPPYVTAMAKREFIYMPVFGWFFLVFRMLMIDRKNLEKAKLSLEKAAQRIRERQATIVISPEGTRSKDGSLGPFKLGPFHLASAVKAPMIPAVIRGAFECQPVGKLTASPGVVEIEFYDPMPTHDFEPENLHQKRDELFAFYRSVLKNEAQPLDDLSHSSREKPQDKK